MADKSDDLIISMATEMAALRRSFSRIESEVTGFSNKVNRRFHSMGRSIDRTFDNVGRNMMRSLTGPLAGIGGVLATREVMQYADAWTEAGNKIAAAGSVVGMAGRNLEGIRQIADDSRAAFGDTVNLYSRLLRSAGDVASSELEIAKATETVNKAFKAGGAAASEMSAGILQLSQGLSSGMLQGDELRSVRENAPLLAEAIADYFGTTIGGLKDLGAQGELTSEKIFKAILSAGPKIEAAFQTTNATIQDSITRVQNALVQYIGSADQSMGATVALNAGLNALADNFDQFADVGLKLAAILAGALVGRSIIPMVAALGTAGKGVTGFIRMLMAARTGAGGLAAAFGSLTAAAGPLAMIIGGGVMLGLQHMVAENARVKGSIERITSEMESLGLAGHAAAEGLEAAADATDKLAEAEARREGRQAQENLDVLRHGTLQDEFAEPFTANIDLANLDAIADRANDIRNAFASGVDKDAYQTIKDMAAALSDGAESAETVRAEMLAIRETDVSQNVADLAMALDEVARRWGAMEAKVAVTGVAFDDALSALEGFYDTLEDNARAMGFSDDIIAELEGIAEEFDGTSESAEDTFDAIMDLRDANGLDMGWLESVLIGLTSNFLNLADAARLARAEMDAATGVSTTEKIRTFREADAASMVPITQGQEYLSELDRLNSLTREQRDLESEIASIRKDMPEGSFATEAEIEARARANLAWKEDNKKSGGGGKSDAQEFAERLEQERQSAALLQQEAAMLAQINPLAKNYETTIEAWRKEQELLNEARKAGLDDDPAVIAGIKEIVAAWQAGQEAIEAVQTAQEAARQSMEDWFDLAKTSVRGFIGDLLEGKSAAEALSNALSNIGNRLIDLGLDALFGGIQASGFNPLGFLTGIFGFASGTANTGGARGEPRGIVHGQEAVIPLPGSGKVPVEIRGPSVPNVSFQPAPEPQSLTVRVVSDDDKFSAYVEDKAGRVVAQSAPTIVGAAVGQANKSAPAAMARHQQQRAGSDYRTM